MTYSTTRNQQQSPLLRLPGELRNRIYELALSGFCIISEYKCDEGKAYLVVYRDEIIKREGAKDLLDGTHYQDTNKAFKAPQFRALTTACRQLFAETESLPLTLNEVVAVPFFMNYPTDLRHLRRIQRLRLILRERDFFWYSDGGSQGISQKLDNSLRDIKEACGPSLQHLTVELGRFHHSLRPYLDGFAAVALQRVQEIFGQGTGPGGVEIRVDFGRHRK